MTTSEMSASEIPSGWLSVDVDSDKCVAVFDDGVNLWLEIQDGPKVKGVFLSRQSADAIFHLLGVTLGYIEDQA